MAFLNTKQAEERLLNSIVSGAVNTALTVTTRTYALLKSTFVLALGYLKLQDFSNGVHITIAGTTAAQTGTIELWGYPVVGSAEYLGTYTYTLGTQTAEPNPDLSPVGVYADEFVESVAGIRSVTIIGAAYDNGKGSLKFDTSGYQYIAGLLTVVSAGTHKVYLRPW